MTRAVSGPTAEPENDLHDLFLYPHRNAFAVQLPLADEWPIG
jgi:hypothetical protein